MRGMKYIHEKSGSHLSNPRRAANKSRSTGKRDKPGAMPMKHYSMAHKGSHNPGY